MKPVAGGDSNSRPKDYECYLLPRKPKPDADFKAAYANINGVELGGISVLWWQGADYFFDSKPTETRCGRCAGKAKLVREIAEKNPRKARVLRRAQAVA